MTALMKSRISVQETSDPAGEIKTDGEGRRVELCVEFRGGTPSFKEARSSWFAREEGREAVNHQSLDMKVCHTLICFFFLCEYIHFLFLSLSLVMKSYFFIFFIGQ